MVRRGIEQIRVTGGEPLMRQGISAFYCRTYRQLKQNRPETYFQ